ncbi:MAG TPA: diacylglycerol kinase [Ramlibacter sp.]|jgi:diacylglycerol kinase (ATP)|nr:diacylglycerol kinase [Ramlibacter sp.]
MSSTQDNLIAPAEQQKRRSGLDRIWRAAQFSLAGLRAGWRETAFRQEAIAAIVLVPASFWLGRTWLEVSMLAGSTMLILIVELLNTGIENAIDRIGPQWHELSKRAKDMGSAAVLLSVVLCAGIWIGALYARFGA